MTQFFKVCETIIIRVFVAATVVDVTTEEAKDDGSQCTSRRIIVHKIESNYTSVLNKNYDSETETKITVTCTIFIGGD